MMVYLPFNKLKPARSTKPQAKKIKDLVVLVELRALNNHNNNFSPRAMTNLASWTATNSPLLKTSWSKPQAKTSDLKQRII